MSSHNDMFRIDFPDGWEDRTVHYFLGPDDSGVQHALNLVVDRESKPNDLVDYATERIDHVINAMPNAQILKEEEKTFSNDIPAYEAVYKWMPPGGEVTFQKLIYIIRDGVAYSFSANFSKKTMKTIAVEVDRIIESFEPIDAK